MQQALRPEPSPQYQHAVCLASLVTPVGLSGEGRGTFEPRLLSCQGGHDGEWMSTAHFPVSQISPWASLDKRLLCFVPIWCDKSRIAAWAGMKDSSSDGFHGFSHPSN